MRRFLTDLWNEFLMPVFVVPAIIFAPGFIIIALLEHCR